MLQVIIFDFDGVIAESVDVKTEAFKELFKAYPDKVKAIADFHIDNGGMSRFDKFRHIYKNILKKKLTEKTFEQLCKSFHNLVIDEVVKAPFVKGAKEVLDFCQGRYRMYVVSGTPYDEIKDIIEKRRLDKYFIAVYGSPDTKTKSILTILEENKCDSAQILFIGDSKNDYQAACETGVIFAARVIGENQKWLKEVLVKFKFRDLIELLRLLKSTIER
ncbi:MAG: HAD-IA family hydrolase [Candidatus Orphnella occulta]|nr:HAD-IA family hydrolase [Candidatus Orphnella occulta]